VATFTSKVSLRPSIFALSAGGKMEILKSHLKRRICNHLSSRAEIRMTKDLALEA
jgi:hypothetical protein